MILEDWMAGVYVCGEWVGMYVGREWNERKERLFELAFSTQADVIRDIKKKLFKNKLKKKEKENTHTHQKKKKNNPQINNTWKKKKLFTGNNPKHLEMIIIHKKYVIENNHVSAKIKKLL